MSSNTLIPATYDTQFPLEMLRDIALLDAPYAVAESYGFDFERIKDLPNFKAQLGRVEAELHADGTLTRAMAEIGLSKAVETINLRIAGGAISNEDLNKFTNTLHKVSNRDADKGSSNTKPQFTIEINLGGDSITLTSKPTRIHEEKEVQEALEVLDAEVESTGSAGSVPVLDVFEEDSEIPQDLLNDIFSNNDFGVEID